MAKEQRFERVYTQGALQITEIWVKPVVSPLLNR